MYRIIIIIFVIFILFYWNSSRENFVINTHSPYCSSGLKCVDYRDCKNGYCESGCCKEFPNRDSDKYIPAPIANPISGGRQQRYLQGAIADPISGRRQHRYTPGATADPRDCQDAAGSSGSRNKPNLADAANKVPKNKINSNSKNESDNCEWLINKKYKLGCGKMNNKFDKIIKLDSEDCDCSNKGENVFKLTKFKNLFPNDKLMYKLNNTYLNDLWREYKYR